MVYLLSSEITQPPVGKRADIRPQYTVFPEDKGGFAIDDQYYVGDSGILVKPVTTEGATTTDGYISDNQVSVLYHQISIILTI